MTRKKQEKKYLTVSSLQFQPLANTVLGRVISYLQQQPGSSAKELAGKILQTRCLPFIMDKNDPNFKLIALQCASECEAWARMIREYAGLSPSYQINDINSSTKRKK